jgi:NADH:ubiquinone reductase (H+-translocating)
MHGTVEKPLTERAVETTPRPRVVILGAGFGGLDAAKTLGRADVDLTVVDRRNYHLFQPLLYQVATAGLSPAQIATPIRRILGRRPNTTILMDRVVDVDLDANEVVTTKHRLPFDYLIVATGARHAYFGHDEWEEYAPGLKKIDEATQIRRRILLAFEQAEVSNDEEERRRLLTFAVIGGGPTGVEMAGAIAELAKRTVPKDFHRVDPAQSRIVLVEAGPRILAAFPEDLSEAAERQLEQLGAEVVKGDPVVDCTPDGVTLKSGRRIEASTIVWAAGVMASAAAKWLKASADRVGRVLVGPDLRLPGRSDIFVIGDTAFITDAAGRVVPGVAPAAKQMGSYAAKSILADIAGKPAPPPFKYRDYGNLATIGRKAAVADFGRIHLTGFLAWIVWTVAHIWFLIGFRNRLAVFLDWAWAYFTHDRGARIITGNEA